jgi:hypothetical protein
LDRKSFGLPKYIRKLDFINSFIKPQSEWFVQEDLIIELLTKKNKNLNDDEDEYDQDDLNLDPYEYYKEHGHNKNADLVRILEGKKADQEAKQYICNTYPHIENIIDYDLKDYKGDFASAYSDTIENLKKHKQAIMFQPVFIYNDIAIAKPDALIKDGDQLIIIETKCTPKCKPLHLIDITYQYQLINAVLKNNNHKPINHAFFCLVKYALLLKNQIGFTLTPYCALKNNDPGNATKNLSYIEKINIKSAYKLAINLDLKIIDALRLKIKNDGNSNIDAYIKINQTVLTRIEELYKALTTFKPHLPKFTPSLTYQN